MTLGQLFNNLTRLEIFSRLFSNQETFQSGKLVNVMSNEAISNVTNTRAIKIEPLGKKATLQELTEKVNELCQKVNSIKVRDRGPKSERAMTDEDAQRVKFGDLEKVGHKEAASTLGLSYGQIYSCRGGYTFNHVTKDQK